MTGRALPADRPALEALWQEAFGDTPEYIALFFDRRFRAEDTFVYREGSAVLGMSFALPLTVRLCGEALPARYLYAVAVGESYRGRGVAAALLEGLHVQLAAEGCALTVTVPAEESLFSFYRRRGFETAFSLGRLEFSAESALPPMPAPLRTSFAAEAETRRRWLSGRALWCEWDAAALTYLDEELRFQGGAVYSLPGRAGYFAAYPAGKGWLVKELAGELLPAEAAAALRALHGNVAVSFRLPPEAGNAAPFAMLRPCRALPLPKEAGYLSLVLD